MNSKRQTVWLVSMLSLMVVLSAYYLFTDDVKDFQLNSKELSLNEVKLDATQAANANTTGAKAAEVSGQNKQKQQNTDAEVLKKIQAQGKTAAEFFSALQLKRTEELAKRGEELMKIITNSKNNNEAVIKAQEEYYRIQDMEEKVDNLEAVLMNDFANALVTQEGNRWKVIVQSEKLERSQAVSIVDLVMKEMNIGPEKITIQHYTTY